MQAAGLIGAFGAIFAGRAEVAFSDQPNLRDYKLGLLHATLDEILEDGFNGSLLGNLQEQLHSQMRIEPPVAGRFHTWTILANPGAIAIASAIIFDRVRFMTAGSDRPRFNNLLCLSTFSRCLSRWHTPCLMPGDV